MPAPTRSRCRARGFTLVELMVAMVGGLFVSIAVFALAKHASGFSMRQARIADTTLQSVAGFERLKADIARAGFLSTPNIVRDRSVCRDAADPLYPAALAELASVYIEPIPTTELSSESTLNGLTPSRIVLAGSYSSPDQFVARAITQGPPAQVHLSPSSLGMANIGYHVDPTADTLARAFPVGRALRIVDETGRMQFATIAGLTGGSNPSITLGAAPVLQFRSGSSLRCGIRGHGKNLVNVVNLIRYDLRDVSANARFKHMFRGGPEYEATRQELVREELDASGNPIADSLELVAEYAVDLGFSLLVAPNGTGGLVRVSGANVITYADQPSSLATGNGPQLIRAVHAWLSVRSREADRTAPLELATTAPGPNLLRISLHDTDPTLPPFARVRTLQSMIPLNNQARATWQ